MHRIITTNRSYKGVRVNVQERAKTFETNSSSTHAVVVANEHYNASPLEPDSDEAIHVQLGFFGFGPEVFNDLYRKLQYILTLAYELEYKHYVDSEIDSGNIPEEDRINEFHKLSYPNLFMETDGFRKIDAVMYRYCSYHIVPEPAPDNFASVDHQSSTDCYKCLDDFFDEHGITLEQLLFDTGIYIVILGDCGYYLSEVVPKDFIDNAENITWSGRAVVDISPDDDLSDSEWSEVDDYEEDEDSYDDEEYSGLGKEGRFVYDDEAPEEFPDYYDEKE